MSHVQILVVRKSESLLTAETLGLLSSGHPEIVLEFHHSSLTQEAENYLRHVSDYVLTHTVRLAGEETLSYGYWLTRFRAALNNKLEVWEYNPTATEFVKGVTLTLQYWKDQHSMCAKYGGNFSPPRPEQLTVISAGVLEGLPVQGVRYSSPDHMSGWWITTEDYDGDITNLRNEHTYHVTAARPDLAQYLALPNGFRFDLSTREDVWFESEIAEENAGVH